MPNPFNALNPNNPMRGYDFNSIRSVYQSMAGGNPLVMLQNAAARNPQLQPIMQALKNGANPQQLFYSACQQRGIDPNEFLRQMTGNNGR